MHYIIKTLGGPNQNYVREHAAVRTGGLSVTSNRAEAAEFATIGEALLGLADVATVAAYRGQNPEQRNRVALGFQLVRVTPRVEEVEEVL